MTELSLESLVDEARAGNRHALNDLVKRVQQPIYGLAVRMLWHPEDARDATQEILVRFVQHLGSFRGESRFMTWAYRVAANYLRTCRRSRVEEERYTFKRFGEELDGHLAEAPADDEWPADRATLLEEVKVGCMLGMLTCLDRESRLAYVLGEILELEGPEAADISRGAAQGACPRRDAANSCALPIAFRTKGWCRDARSTPGHLRRLTAAGASSHLRWACAVVYIASVGSLGTW